MLYIVKNAGRKFAYDSVSGAFIKLSALEYKMLSAVEPPLEKVCPTSLRYELAKFDSEDVSETYSELYTLANKGIIFADGSKISVKLEGDYAADSFEAAKAAIDASFADAAAGFEFQTIGKCGFSDEILAYSSEIRKTLGK